MSPIKSKPDIEYNMNFKLFDGVEAPFTKPKKNHTLWSAFVEPYKPRKTNKLFIAYALLIAGIIALVLVAWIIN